MFCYRHGYAYDVNLLKAVTSNHTARNISGNCNNRDGIKKCRSNSRYKIGCARPRGCNNSTDLTRSSRIAVSRMSRALFMSGKNMIYTVTVKIKLVEKVDDLTSRITENGIAALFDKGFNNNFCS